MWAIQIKCRRQERRFCVLTGWLLVASGGCSTPFATVADTSPVRPPQHASTAGRADSAERDGLPSAATADAKDSGVVDVVDSLRQVNEIDPAAIPALLAELERTPSESWSGVAAQFRASLAYHKRLTVRQADTAGDPTAGTERHEDPGVPPVLENTKALSTSVPPPVAQASYTSSSDSEAAARSTIDKRAADATSLSSPQSPIRSSNSPKPGSQSPTGWQHLVELAAEELGAHVEESPSSTAEIHEHVMLRMLRLLAGDTEGALEPIPRISPSEQDYWSRQLFALATYLDHHNQPDDKRRAAAGAMHLDEALAQLRQIGSLSLRNLTFCKKVVAFGAYEPYEQARFAPGQTVTLYVEAENYYSRSTEEGFVTLLGSSYEILNEAGERVDGGEFPDVNDRCRSRRRDFHIQYGLTLPTKLSAGHYRLQLVVRDRQSNKLGNASVAFEVGSGATRPEPRTEAAK